MSKPECEDFPKWMYGPDGQARVCKDQADVPEGWVTHPRLLVKPAKSPEVRLRKPRDPYRERAEQDGDML